MARPQRHGGGREPEERRYGGTEEGEGGNQERRRDGDKGVKAREKIKKEGETKIRRE